MSAYSFEHLVISVIGKRSFWLRTILLMTKRLKNVFLLFHFSKCPGGEIGRRTGLKILSFGQTGVPVQVWPGAPLQKSNGMKFQQTEFFGLEDSGSRRTG